LNFFQILVLAVVQGAAELLPVSSSAHVIVAGKLMGLDPTTPEMTLLLVMLHTGTMFAVILYFWKSWRETFFASRTTLLDSIRLIVTATVLTGVVGVALKVLIEKVFLGGAKAEIEMIFGNLGLISGALAVVGLLIVYSGLRPRRESAHVGAKEAAAIGAVQGLCLPFRGFSRSGATISAGLLLGVARTKAEEFSFALAVVLTPPVIAREVLRLLRAQQSHLVPQGTSLTALFLPGLCGMVLSFVSGLLALRWLSRWLEGGRWHYFGYYCLAASLLVFTLYRLGM